MNTSFRIIQRDDFYSKNQSLVSSVMKLCILTKMLEAVSCTQTSVQRNAISSKS